MNWSVNRLKSWKVSTCERIDSVGIILHPHGTEWTNDWCIPRLCLSAMAILHRLNINITRCFVKRGRCNRWQGLASAWACAQLHIIWLEWLIIIDTITLFTCLSVSVCVHVSDCIYVFIYLCVCWVRQCSWVCRQCWIKGRHLLMILLLSQRSPRWTPSDLYLGWMWSCDYMICVIFYGVRLDNLP